MRTAYLRDQPVRGDDEGARDKCRDDAEHPHICRILSPHDGMRGKCMYEMVMFGGNTKGRMHDDTATRGVAADLVGPSRCANPDGP